MKGGKMKIVDTYGSFEEALARSGEPVKEIAKRLRGLIAEIYPEAVEVPWPAQGIIGYGVGPKKMSEHFCYIAPQKEYVNLGFYYGSALPDPDGLLDGTGKLMRHVKVHSLEEAARTPLRQLIMISVEERKKTLGRG
jgi:hypothetical protein